MIHRFSQNIDETSPDRFTATLESNRSEVEQQNTLLQIHDPESADLRFARSLADEMIYVSGANVKVYIRTDNADYDSVWDEDADPTYWNVVHMKAYFKPETLEFELKKWGIEAVTKTNIIFSHKQVYEQFGERMLRSGDVIQVPYNSTKGPKNFRIENATPSGNYRYHWLYLTCAVETLTADVTVRPDEDIMGDDPMNTGGQYRESL